MGDPIYSSLAGAAAPGKCEIMSLAAKACVDQSQLSTQETSAHLNALAATDLKF